ncbi:MAG: ABC transporter permease [Thermomicrobiales bacterium]
MLQYILRRLVLLVPVLFGVSIVIFGLIRMIPGDAAMLAIGVDQRITEEQREAVRRSYGLDQPLPVQYVRWMGHVLQGDLGQSLRTRRPITDELRLRMPVTIQLALMAGILGTIPAIVMGVIAAVKRNSPADYLATVGTLLGISAPNFLIAILLILLFSYKLKWLPPVGYKEFMDDPVQNLRSMILPAISLSLPLAAVMMRNTRSAVLEVLNQDYVRVARAKGLASRRVLIRHVMPNASLPIITVAGLQIAGILGGTVIVEQIFGLPGLGRYIYDAINNRDYPVVQGVTLVVATMFVLISMLVDVLYAVVDPRLRKS